MSWRWCPFDGAVRLASTQFVHTVVAGHCTEVVSCSVRTHPTSGADAAERECCDEPEVATTVRVRSCKCPSQVVEAAAVAGIVMTSPQMMAYAAWATRDIPHRLVALRWRGML